MLVYRDGKFNIKIGMLFKLVEKRKAFKRFKKKFT